VTKPIDLLGTSQPVGCRHSVKCARVATAAPSNMMHLPAHAASGTRNSAAAAGTPHRYLAVQSSHFSIALELQIVGPAGLSAAPESHRFAARMATACRPEPPLHPRAVT
jgi:hypothetical protein